MAVEGTGVRLGGFENVLHVLRIRNYRVYTAGNSISLIGTWMQRISVGWLAWQLTGSPVWLGLVAVADLAPTLVLSPVAGFLADRLDRIQLIRLTQIFAMTQAAALAALTFTGLISIESLLFLTLALGAVNAVNQPARLALIPSLVERSVLGPAVAINALVFNTARFIGPALAGPAVHAGGFALAFLANAVSYLAFLAALTQVRLSAAEESGSGERAFWRDTVAGYAYALNHPGIGRMIALFAVTCFSVRGFIELFPGFADVVFRHGDPTGLMATLGLGAIAGGLWMVRRSGIRGLTGLVMTHNFLIVASALAFTATANYGVALVCVFVCGFAMVSTGISAQTLVQSAVDPSMRGRVLGFYGMLFRGGPAFSALVLGGLASFIGFRLAVAAGAVVSLAYWAWARLHQDRMEAALEAEARGAAPP